MAPLNISVALETAEVPALALPRLARAIRSAWCVMTGGHWKLRHNAPNRLALRCVACGHTTTGWEVGRASAR
jgi:hypothetical protein